MHRRCKVGRKPITNILLMFDTQASPVADSAALHATLEPLTKLVAAHAGGKEGYARGIALQLFEDFLAVEEQFQTGGAATEQEVIDTLRQVSSCPATSLLEQTRPNACNAHSVNTSIVAETQCKGDASLASACPS